MWLFVRHLLNVHPSTRAAHQHRTVRLSVHHYGNVSFPCYVHRLSHHHLDGVVDGWNGEWVEWWMGGMVDGWSGGWSCEWVEDRWSSGWVNWRFILNTTTSSTFTTTITTTTTTSTTLTTSTPITNSTTTTTDTTPTTGTTTPTGTTST